MLDLLEAPTKPNVKRQKNRQKTALTARQNRALEALLIAKTHTEAADLAGIAPRTLRVYLKNPIFRAALLDAETEARAAANRRLAMQAGGALDVVAEIYGNQDNPPNLRLAAAKAWLDYHTKAADYTDFDKRITELEKRILYK